MYARGRRLADVPTTGRQYYPTAAELANAQAAASANGWGTVGQPWNIEADGSTFEVPTNQGGMPGYTSGYQVRFGFGRGAFANFPPPPAGSGTSPQAGGAGVTVPVAQPPQPVLIAAPAQPAPEPPPAAVVPAPAAAVAVVTQPDGSQVAVPVQTAALEAAQPPAPAAAGFDIAAFLKGLLAAPAMQPVEAQAAAAAAPYVPQVAGTLGMAWVKAHQAQLVVGGVAVVGGILVLRALRR